MSVRGLQTLLVMALTDRRQAEALLRGSPAAYEGFDLSAGEIQNLGRIRAESLADYARQAHLLLYHEDLALEDNSQGCDCMATEQEAPLRDRPCAEVARSIYRQTFRTTPTTSAIG